MDGYAQLKLIELAKKPTDWTHREVLFKEEEQLLKSYPISVFSEREMHHKSEIERYAKLTSLPFHIVETGDVSESEELDLLEHFETVDETLLHRLWKLQTIDETATLPTGSIAPEYFIVGATQKGSRLSFVDNVFLRKALIRSGVYYRAWCTHVLKFQDSKFQDHSIDRQRDYLELEIELLKPAALIALGQRVHAALNFLAVKIPIIPISEPDYYQKHKHPYEEYAEAIKNVIEMYWEKHNDKESR